MRANGQDVLSRSDRHRARGIEVLAGADGIRLLCAVSTNVAIRTDSTSACSLERLSMAALML